MSTPQAAARATGAGGVALETIRFPVAGMVCASCVNQITRALRRLDGVDRVRVDLGGETVTVRRDVDSGSDAALAAAIAGPGYEARLDAVIVVPDDHRPGFLARLRVR